MPSREEHSPVPDFSGYKRPNSGVPEGDYSRRAFTYALTAGKIRFKLLFNEFPWFCYLGSADLICLFLYFLFFWAMSYLLCIYSFYLTFAKETADVFLALFMYLPCEPQNAPLFLRRNIKSECR